VNQQTVFEYDRSTSIEAAQSTYLDTMDVAMRRGLKIHGELIINPDKMQRARFVALNLIKALQQDNEAVISVACAYLVSRCPALREVQANDEGTSVEITLVEKP